MVAFTITVSTPTTIGFTSPVEIEQFLSVRVRADSRHLRIPLSGGVNLVGYNQVLSILMLENVRKNGGGLLQI